MAGNNSIKVLRGTRANIAQSSETLEAGQILYNTDDNYMSVGGPNGTDPVNKQPIKTRAIGGYFADSTGISSNTGTQYYIGPTGSGNIKAGTDITYLDIAGYQVEAIVDQDSRMKLDLLHSYFKKPVYSKNFTASDVETDGVIGTTYGKDTINKMPAVGTNYTLTLPNKTGTIATLDDITTAIGDINTALTTLNTGTGV